MTTSTAQLFSLSLLGHDVLKADEAPVFEAVLTNFHSGAILGMDVCTRKPLVVTCGMDKSVRVWNYLEKTCELCKFFNEEAYSVAFHPSGFHLIIGFSDKLRLMNLLMEDMRTYKDIPIKADAPTDVGLQCCVVYTRVKPPCLGSLRRDGPCGAGSLFLAAPRRLCRKLPALLVHSFDSSVFLQGIGICSAVAGLLSISGTLPPPHGLVPRVVSHSHLKYSCL